MCNPTAPDAAPPLLDYDDVSPFAPVGPPAPCTDCGIPVVRLETGTIRSTERDMEIDRVRCKVASDTHHHLPDVL